jgi:signal peptidase I
VIIFIVRPVRVEGQSMENSYHDGQLLLMERVSVYADRLDRFDVIVFPDSPADGSLSPTGPVDGNGTLMGLADNNEAPAGLADSSSVNGSVPASSNDANNAGGSANDTLLIKRIIGLPGENVRIDEDGNIYINDEILEENYGKETIMPYREDGGENLGIALEGITLGEDEYFVLGDNRNASKDSRFIGPVNRKDISGRICIMDPNELMNRIRNNRE